MMMGPTDTVFNFADGGPEPIRNGLLFWLGRLYNKPEFGGYELYINRANGGGWNDLAMYRYDPAQADFAQHMPKDMLFRSEQSVASMRSSWDDSNALFVAFKGGWNQASHCDLDIGTFVLDALGVRFITELGSEYYEAPGMWDMGIGAGRWKYYRKAVEGQNTLVINPKATEAQDVFATSEIYKFETSDAAAYGLVDMKQAYAAEATDVKRGFALVNNRSSVIVQDEIKTKSPSEIYSFFHTGAALDIAPDGKSAIMTLQGKKMRANLLSPSNASFIEMDSTPLPTSIAPPMANRPNSNIRKLTVHMTGATNPTISVMFTPIADSQPQPALPSVIPLSSWDSFKTGASNLQSLSIDNIPVSNFSEFNTFYSVETGILGQVSATAAPNLNINIKQAEKVGDSAFITVNDRGTGLESIYTVSFEEKLPPEISSLITYYDIVDVKASDIPEPANVPKNTFDNDLTTRWAAENDASIEWDLGEIKDVDTIMLSFMNGAARQAIFGLEVSEDGVHYVNVFEGQSSGKTEELEEYKFNPLKARYIKFNGKGNTVSTWNSITEVAIPSKVEGFSDITNHWAELDILRLASCGLIKGVSQTNFNPDATITRAEFITIISRLLKLSENGYNSEFSDISENDWYAELMAAAKEAKIIPEELYSDGNLYPNSEITREEMTAIIVKAYESQADTKAKAFGLGNFDDGDEISPYAREYVEKGLSLRIVQGLSGNEFGPKNNATRAQATVLAKRLLIKISS